MRLFSAPPASRLTACLTRTEQRAIGRWKYFSPHTGLYRFQSTLSSPHEETKVAKILHDTIKAAGPVSFATYMQMCLSHPTHGYYMDPGHAVLGSKGDFITSPEISQVFGELVGVWLLSQWLNSQKRKNIRLVELGPGRGTLMADVLRTFSQFPQARSAIKEIHLIETSPPMRTMQQNRLAPTAEQNRWNIEWHDTLDKIPSTTDTYTMVLAHEFFDALPFHLLQKGKEGWHEVLIASGPDPAAPTILRPSASTLPSSSIDAKSSPSVSSLSSASPSFRPVLSPTPSPVSTLLGSSSRRFQSHPEGSRIEVSPAAFKVAHRIGELLSEGKEGAEDVAGCALIMDYGGDKVYGNSFRAFKEHKIVDIFHRPGECDLTTNVDFGYLKEAIGALAVTHGPISQASFLTRMGLELRVNALKKSASSAKRAEEIEGAAKRLVDLTGMGAQYQFMAITSTRTTEPLSPPKAEETWPFVDQ